MVGNTARGGECPNCESLNTEINSFDKPVEVMWACFDCGYNYFENDEKKNEWNKAVHRCSDCGNGTDWGVVSRVELPHEQIVGDIIVTCHECVTQIWNPENLSEELLKEAQSWVNQEEE